MTDKPILESTPCEGVVLLKLNRPAVLNVLNLDLRRELAHTFTRLDGDDSVRAIVLAGEGRAFCAGADLNEYVDAAPIEVLQRDMGRLWDAIASCRKPVVAAVRGYALGGGCELAMHADIVVAGEGARFGQPEILIGLMPGGGATQRLTRAVGKHRAMLMMLTGEPVTAADAERMGLVSRVVPDDQVDTEALRLASTIAGHPTLAVRSIKESVLAGMDATLSTGLELERKAFQLLFATPEKTEGIRARLEKRAPKYR